jgi:uncharacterized protein (TIGR02099 family)
MLKRIFTALYHFCWYTFAFVVLTAAVLVTVVRLALPEIGGYKDEIQSWVSEYMDYPVVIDEITAEWQGWVPHLYLKKIDLYTPDNNKLIGQFESAHLGIDPIASINNRELVPSQLTISGLNLEFTRNDDGSISINNENNNLNSTSDNSALSVWLLKQKHILLENAKLSWHDKKTYKEKLEFSNVQLVLKTDNERIQIGADIVLPEEHGRSLSVKMDTYGNILTPDWKGKVYIEANEVNPTRLLENFPIKSRDGLANVKLWTNWEKSKLINLNAEVNYSNFVLNTDQYTLPIQDLNLIVQGERQREKDWLLNLSVEEIQTNYESWPASNYQLIAIKNDTDDTYQYSGYASYINLETVSPFLHTTNIIPDSLIEIINWQSLKGELTNSHLLFNPNADSDQIISYDTSFKNLSIATGDDLYTVKKLDGEISGNDKIAKINLNSNSTELILDSTFEKPFSFTNINADLELHNDDSIKLVINEAQIEDESISAKSTGKIIFDKEKSPFIDIVVHIDKTSIENLPQYLPKQSSSELKTWFAQAMVGGDLLSTNLIYHGYTADFPFENSEGNFKTIFNIENATINYAEDWPPVDKVTAEIVINNNDLYFTSDHAYIFDGTINNLKASIKQLSNDDHNVIVEAAIAGHTSDVGNFIKQSPLNEDLALRELTENIYGGVNININLDIPLNEEKTKLDGQITFTDTTIESNLPGLGLEGVNGVVNFTRDATWASDIDALYHGRPVKLDIPKFDQSETDSESYIISGTADKDFFITELTSFFPTLMTTAYKFGDKFSGESNWSLALSKASHSANSRQVEFKSDLKGISIDLPYPIGKEIGETSSLSIKTSLSDLLITEINIAYDNNIYADFNVDNTKDLIVKNILIGLGSKHPTLSTINNISIHGELEKLNMSDWIDFINSDQSLSSLENETTKKQKTINGDVYIKSFNMLGNEFSNVSINFNKPVNDWQIIFDSETIKGETTFVSSEKNRVYANFEKLTLKSSDEDEETRNQIAIDKIPELDVNVEEFTYNENTLGQLSLLTSNVDNGININNLSIIKPGFNINAKGEWLRIDEVDRSDFHATLEAETIDSMLETFGFDTANIKDGETKIEMNAYWMDTPMNFAMEKIDGELDMKIDKGSFLDIDPSAGRLFGLLSIQTLPRRLTLDFSDLFEEGFAFDSIEGNFSLQQGHAYTNNLEMTGPSADIIVSGRTGLSTEDYDQIATVTPKFSSNLPVASALFGPVGVGVGAVFYIAGEIFDAIPKKIDQILSAQYTITGSWDQPNIEKITEEKESG